VPHARSAERAEKTFCSRHARPSARRRLFVPGTLGRRRRANFVYGIIGGVQRGELGAAAKAPLTAARS
jgi:hypothetical protein